MPNSADVSTPVSAYTAMQPAWDLVDTLRGGTQAMRDAGAKYLPQEPREEALAWQCRRDRSFLFNAYGDTIDAVAGKPFTKPITIENAAGLDPLLADLAADVDRSGTSLTAFGRRLFVEGLQRGVVHILVEYPRAPENLSLADASALRVRPYFCLVSAKDLIGWRFGSDATGRPVLTSIRIRKTESVPDGRYGEKQQDTVQEVEVGQWAVYAQAEGTKAWTAYAGGERRSSNGATMPISLVTINFCGEDGFVAKPVFENLAWLNLAHWQSYSDQRNILRFARTGILFQKGVSDDEAKKPLTMGPTATFRATSPSADMKFVEHSGSSIGAGRQDLLDLQEAMEFLGMMPFVSRKGSQTATGQGIDETRANTDVMAWIEAVEAGFLAAFRYAAQWIGKELPEKFRIRIFSDFALSVRAAEEVRALVDIRKAGEITRETFLSEVKRRGILSDSVNTKAESEAAAQQGAPLGGVSGNPLGVFG